jgi:hypothetical protein
MASTPSEVPLTEVTRHRLTELERRLGVDQATVIEEAVRRLHESNEVGLVAPRSGVYQQIGQLGSEAPELTGHEGRRLPGAANPESPEVIASAPAPGPTTGGAEWAEFNNLIAKLRAEPPHYHPGTQDFSSWQRESPDPVAAQEWDRLWDEFEQEQKRLARLEREG